MTWDKKDRALIAASSLVGYCMSVGSLPFNSFSEDDHKAVKHWAEGLLNAAKVLGAALDAVHEEINESNVDQPEGDL
jgi:hypothetical protein